MALHHAGERTSLKHNDTFAVLDAHGDINAVHAGSDGLFHRDTRCLSYLTVAIYGRDLLLLGSNISRDGAYQRSDLTNPDIYQDGAIVLLKDQVHCERTTYVRDGLLRQQISIRNYSEKPVELPMTLGFDTDFADLFEVRGIRRNARGKVSRQVLDASRIFYAYEGLDGIRRGITISLEPPPKTLTATSAPYEITLEPRQRFTLLVEASCSAAPARQTSAFLPGLIEARRGSRRKRRLSPEIETGSLPLNNVLRRSAADLALLMTETPQGYYPYAGIPWFSTAFGRDGLITAIETLWYDPGLARSVLRYLASRQAVAQDSIADADPGKILHEVRGGEMSGLGEVPFGLYYGSVDSTPLFVILAGLYAERTGDDAFLLEIWDNIERAIQWMRGPGDADGDGFIEYFRATHQGLSNQGWKDSVDAIFHANGQLAKGPIALVEVQAYAYEAKRLAARAARRLGKTSGADRLDEEAANLKRNFDQAFWCEEIGTYALALDGSKAQCKVRSSNAGQVLRSGIAPAAHAHAVSAAMLSPQFYSGWGIRTVADTEARFNPMSYHNGSIWPHDNALIASGIADYSSRDAPARILSALSDAASLMDQQRLPELFCGFRRRRDQAPILYPVACSPQAWASGAMFLLLQSMLGLEIDGHKRVITFNRPSVPRWLDYVTLRGLSVGDARADIRLSRDNDGAVKLDTLSSESGIEVRLV